MCPAFLFKSGLYLEPILLVAVPAAPLSLLALSFRSQDVFGGNCYFSYSLRIGLPPSSPPINIASLRGRPLLVIRDNRVG